MPAKFSRRRYSRILFTAPALLLHADDKQWHSHIVDISLNGVLLSRPEGWQGFIQQNASLIISLPESDIKLQLKLQVAHVSAGVIGFRCVKVSLESKSHLYRLVELNLGDPSLLYRELAELSQA